MAYTDQAKIELVHGRTNIRVWSDLDNDKNSTKIAERCTWAADLATEYVNGRLMLQRYVVPFTSVPKIIQHLASLYAGTFLYDGRPQQNEARDKLSWHRKESRKILREIINGQLKLLNPTSGAVIETPCYTAPFVVSGSGVISFGSYSIMHCGCPTTVFCYPGYAQVLLASAYCQECLCHTCVCRSIYTNW